MRTIKRTQRLFSPDLTTAALNLDSAPTAKTMHYSNDADLLAISNGNIDLLEQSTEAFSRLVNEPANSGAQEPAPAKTVQEERKGLGTFPSFFNRKNRL